MNSKPDTRQFKRFSIDFKIEVVAHDMEGREHMEKTILEEISGEGARFLTGKQHYFIGQSLGVSIYLPGTDEIKANMQGRATVVRITQGGNSDENKMNQPAYIAIKFDTPLQFERNDPSA